MRINTHTQLWQIKRQQPTALLNYFRLAQGQNLTLGTKKVPWTWKQPWCHGSQHGPSASLSACHLILSNTNPHTHTHIHVRKNKGWVKGGVAGVYQIVVSVWQQGFLLAFSLLKLEAPVCFLEVGLVHKWSFRIQLDLDPSLKSH